MRTLFLVLSLFISCLTYANKKCAEVVSAATSKQSLPNEIWLAFDEVPDLRGLVESFIQDPNKPEQLKALILKAFSTNEVEIHNFNWELKNKYRFASHSESLINWGDTSFKITPGERQNINDQLNTPLEKLYKNYSPKGWFKKKFRLFIPNDDMTGSNIMLHFLALTHELSHVSFVLYMEQHIQDLVGKFPVDFVSRDDNGKVSINSDLFSYLNERYAHEFEFIALRTFQTQSSISTIPLKWQGLSEFDFSNEKDRRKVQTRIASNIRRDYQMLDPRLPQLDELSLETILQQGMNPSGLTLIGIKK